MAVFMCITKSLCCTTETDTTLEINYTSIYFFICIYSHMYMTPLLALRIKSKILSQISSHSQHSVHISPLLGVVFYVTIFQLV